MPHSPPASLRQEAWHLTDQATSTSPTTARASQSRRCRRREGQRPPSSPGSLMRIALAFDTPGNLYVCGNGSLTKVSPTGSVTTNWATPLSGTHGLARDPAGNFYVSNGGTIIYKVQPSGGTGSQIITTGLTTAIGLACDTSGNLYVANNGGTTVTKYTPCLVLSGTPTTGGTYSFTITATDSTARRQPGLFADRPGRLAGRPHSQLGDCRQRPGRPVLDRPLIGRHRGQLQHLSRSQRQRSRHRHGVEQFDHKLHGQRRQRHHLRLRRPG